ncbi:MAG: SLAC1 anion channel family protein [Phyllobacteriaceae bacterium]|nr:SLAC1 anion channel family protein [Phyllobacteriaceae bacterium]
MTAQHPPAAATGDAHSPLMHFPVGFFAMVMGLAGLTLATLRLEHAANAGHAASPFLLGLTVIAFVAIASAYIAKALKFPAAFKADWNHPVRIAFFPAATIGLILLGTAMLPLMPGVGAAVWMIGAALHFALTLTVVSTWIGHRSFEPVHMNPAWFIPAVGNVIVPIVGMKLGYVELSWFFFSVGMVFWIILATLVFNRLIFHAPLPERLMPTLMILVAPPAIGFVSYAALTGGIDPFARILYYAAVMFALVFATQIGKLRKLPFMISWWAYSFPFAALTIATFVYAEMTGIAAFASAAYLLYGMLVLVLAFLTGRTLVGLTRGEILKPE